LPAEPAQLFAWLLDQPHEVVHGLLAYCVAQSVDGITEDEARGPMEDIARAAGLDMREWWTATAESYFGSVSRTRVLEVLTEAVSAEAAAPLAKMKKAALVQAAEEKVAGTGWLPALLRNAD
jgi:ParB family chromosome partitioning protein